MRCLRCGGTGVLLQYIFHYGGICFRCGGSGTDPKELKVFGPKNVCWETTVAGKKVVLKATEDIYGRLTGYEVYVEGPPYSRVECKNIKEAQKAFYRLKHNLKSGSHLN